MDDVSPTDLSSVETLTSSGVTSSTSPVSNYEWENVLHSIQKISGDLRQVWSHIGGTPNQSSRSTSYAHRSKSMIFESSVLQYGTRFEFSRRDFHIFPTFLFFKVHYWLHHLCHGSLWRSRLFIACHYTGH